VSYAIDSAGRISAAGAQQAAAAGVTLSLRYHYNTTRAEIDNIRTGAGFNLIGEFDTATWHPPLHAPQLGAEHAREWLAVARAVGYPTGLPAWLTADVRINPDQLDRPRQYWGLAAPILRDAGYLVGAYGGSFVIDDLVDRGLADLAWEAAAASWSTPTGYMRDYVPSRHRSMLQLVAQQVYGGTTCDINVIYRAVPSWTAGGVENPQPAPTPQPPAPTPPSSIPEEWFMRSLVIDGGDAREWFLTFDGNGQLRKYYISSPALVGVMGAAELLSNTDSVVISDPEQINALNAIPESNAKLADVALVEVGVNAVAAVNLHTDAAVAAIPANVGGGVNEDSVAQHVADVFSQRLSS